MPEHAGWIAIPEAEDGNMGDQVLMFTNSSARIGIQLKAALKAKRITKIREWSNTKQDYAHIGYEVDGIRFRVYEFMHWHGTKYD